MNPLLSVLLLGLALASPPPEPLDVRSSDQVEAAEDQLLGFLEAADVVSSEVIESGITRPLRLTLTDGTTTRDAIFRAIDRTEIDRRRDGQLVRIRDHWAFEVAAYRLARRLGLERVPPTTTREIDGRRGSIQIWVEDATGGTELVVRSAERGPEGIAERDTILREMALFDLLIRNYDRHLDNVLYDAQGRFWWIDHSRSFPPVGSLRVAPSRAQCALPLAGKIAGLEPRAVREDLRDVLTRRELSSLLQRRSELVAVCREGGSEPLAAPTTF